MKTRDLLQIGALSLGAAGIGALGRSFWPETFPLLEELTGPPVALDTSALPKIGVTFLRSGYAKLPEALAVRGSLAWKTKVIAHSAVLIRHPRATFLYDTGLCNNIYRFLKDQSWFFRNTLAKFTFERSLRGNLEGQNIKPRDLDFALLSHLHWDHVSGIPDIPGVPLRVNRVEYDAAQYGLLEANGGLVQRFLGDANPIEFFDCVGPTYEGFRSSLDLLGDGSLVLVPLPGHTAGNTGLFINRSNGSRLFLIGDATWVSGNYLLPATMHPFFWNRVTSDDATARRTLINLHNFAQIHPEIPLIAMHDGDLQEAFMQVERTNVPLAR